METITQIVKVTKISNTLYRGKPNTAFYCVYVDSNVPAIICCNSIAKRGMAKQFTTANVNDLKANDKIELTTTFYEKGETFNNKVLDKMCVCYNYKPL